MAKPRLPRPKRAQPDIPRGAALRPVNLRRADLFHIPIRAGSSPALPRSWRRSRTARDSRAGVFNKPPVRHRDPDVMWAALQLVAEIDSPGRAINMKPQYASFEGQTKQRRPISLT